MLVPPPPDPTSSARPVPPSLADAAVRVPPETVTEEPLPPTFGTKPVVTSVPPPPPPTPAPAPPVPPLPVGACDTASRVPPDTTTGKPLPPALAVIALHAPPPPPTPAALPLLRLLVLGLPAPPVAVTDPPVTVRLVPLPPAVGNPKGDKPPPPPIPAPAPLVRDWPGVPSPPVATTVPPVTVIGPAAWLTLPPIPADVSPPVATSWPDPPLLSSIVRDVPAVLTTLMAATAEVRPEIVSELPARSSVTAWPDATARFWLGALVMAAPRAMQFPVGAAKYA
jgi:hypothetical protein